MFHMIYEDADIMVVHKPAGIPVQTSRLGQKDLVSMLKNYRAQKKEEPYVGVVHRLDQPVEGLLVFAKTKKAAAELSRQSRERVMDKYYRAVVCCGDITGETGEEKILTDYLLRDGKTNTSSVVSEHTKGAKKAVLSYRILRTKDQLAEVSIRLETGRHHQIRVQMAHADMPLVMDRKYGGRAANSVLCAGRGVALCAVKSSFIHPKTGKKMEFEIQPENETFFLFGS